MGANDVDRMHNVYHDMITGIGDVVIYISVQFADT
jgi:hypothetical protein